MELYAQQSARYLLGIKNWQSCYKTNGSMSASEQLDTSVPLPNPSLFLACLSGDLCWVRAEVDKQSLRYWC